MVSSLWAKHIRDQKGKADFNTVVLHSGLVLDRLEAIVDGWIEELRRTEATEDYSSPSWSHLQADRLGQLKSLSKIRKLLDRKHKSIDE